MAAQLTVYQSPGVLRLLEIGGPRFTISWDLSVVEKSAFLLD